MAVNTIVLASDRAYIWGCYLLIASMRRHGMTEPVTILGFDYGPDDVACLKQFGDVDVVLAEEKSERNVCCSKATAMLLPSTEYVTWVDCDGLFLGNCSHRLAAAPDEIHIRLRSAAETEQVFGKVYREGDRRGGIPAHILDAWSRDVGGLDESRYDSVCTSCYISIHRDFRPFIEKWRDQMLKVLPAGNRGVVDHRNKFYHQTDESVINSLLCFYPEAPRIAPDFLLDKVHPEIYVHFVAHPKPWVNWNRQSWPNYEALLTTLEWAIESGYRPPTNPIPKALQRSFRSSSFLISRFSSELRRIRNMPGRLLPERDPVASSAE